MRLSDEYSNLTSHDLHNSYVSVTKLHDDAVRNDGEAYTIV